PDDFQIGEKKKRRLDLWLHGRDDKLTELSFIAGRQKSAGEFTPPGGIVLHLYGRFCNANKFAGEVDVLEALDHVTNHYAIDPDKIIVRGFSMGGASCWHLAVHHPDLWAAAAPGAGFTETPIYMKVFAGSNVPPEWEQKLWHLYDSVDYAANLFNLPTVAYSGEIDKQKQAADEMAKAMSNEGMELVHIIGPNTPHKYHPESKIVINQTIDEILANRKSPVPKKVRFTTWTLKFNQSYWVRVEGLEKHWERARVEAEIAGNAVNAATTNVSELTFSIPPGLSPFSAGSAVKVVIDHKEIISAKPGPDKSWSVRFRKSGAEWKMVSDPPDEKILRKKHDLQGPIDDAFMGRFIFVLPTGASLNDKVGEWTTREAKTAAEEWRAQFRGDVRVVKDLDLSEKDIAECHLILWGDPKSSRVIAKIAD
ncbi:MAG: prolyl oligopeptidase family serine peptidase, partial [Spirochaetia bacterium]|nr:prolyl oligopeptidase family serine peptidase [Spirochaetia bacterium]